jgi:iron complex outermembrane receptor protein
LRARVRAISQAAALLVLAGSAYSQTQAPQALKPVTITGQAFPPAADVTGFGDVPLSELPASASVIDSRQIQQSGARRLADLTRFDPSVADAYDAPGYWDFISVRGYVLDNDYNFRREGLPINAETTIPLDNKERVEILRGTSGMQAGVSAPGGLVNYVVKRPTDGDMREVRLEFTQRASLLGAADIGGRAGRDGAFGYRFNIAQEQLRPWVRNMDGHRSLVAFAGDWRLGGGALLEAEMEWSRKVQASQVGFSLLGTTLPAVPDLRLNLNNQPWAQPSKFDALTGTVRYSQPFARDWRLIVQAGSQRLRNDDFTAFPYGCASGSGAPGEIWFDRYCSNGTFDYWDFRSVGERRRQDAISAEAKGKLTLGGLAHDIAFGILRSRGRETTNDSAFNPVGVGDVSGAAVVPADPTPAPGTATRRDEVSTELSVRDAIRWSDRFSTWLGVRHTRLDRRTLESDASAPGYAQTFTAPWAAVSYKVAAQTMAYASWGEGVESAVVPNKPDTAASPGYTNAGVALPALKSRQTEIGLKGAQDAWTWQLDAFDIHRPMTNIDVCALPCTAAFDGTAHHRGIEGALHWAGPEWRAGATAMVLRARREGSAADPSANGKRPVNVPESVLRAYAAWRVPAVSGLEVQGAVSREGRRSVLADESVMLSAWTRVDASLRYATQMGRTQTTWQLGVDNVTNRRYWRESPYQFGHVYLYPGAPRTVRLSVTAAL